ncbi:hypothetical protein [Lacticaseibacillus absianus]|uniref:hypothetical protein n=1 Tax=Lacticaseibacillus absianus TaxID=2729623 RepID=UPI0015C73A46|nr:hypothetical protein [Lacticaseibacillus absianus]
MKTHQIMWLWASATVLGLIALYLILFRTGYPWLAWAAYLVWLIANQVICRKVIRLRRRALATMWGLADQIDYGPADIQRLAPQYGVIDWQHSRPEHSLFSPSSKTIVFVTTKLQSLIDTRAALG